MSNCKINNPLRYNRPSTKLKPQFRNIDKTLELLEKEDNELKVKLLHTNCSTKLANDREKIVWEIEKRLDRQDEILEEIKQKKADIEHLKLGIKEVDSKSFELAASATSEFQYTQNLKRAKRIKENLESRFTALKKNECSMIAENTRLNDRIEKMMIDRDLFCNTWIKMDNQLAENKTFLLSKTDKLAIVFSESDYLRAEIRSVNEKARRFEAMHLAEARNMVRKNVVDENALTFMAVKLNRRLTGSEANKLSTLMTNTRESNTQMNIRILSFTKELQQLFKKINEIFQVLGLDDRLDDFNIEKKKEIEYGITKIIGILEVELNIAFNEYMALKNPNIKNKLKGTIYTPSREKVKPSAVKDVARKNKECVLPVDVEEIRKEQHITLSKKTESRVLEGISRQSTTSIKSSTVRHIDDISE